MFETIVVPVDGSRNAGRAVEVAADLAKHYQSSLHLLHVIRNLALPTELLDMIAAGEINATRMELLQDSAEIILERASERVRRAGLEVAATTYLIGDPAKTIAQYAEENGADLIVMGAQGLETTPHLLGGVARKLTNITSVNCLLVRGDG